MPTRKRKKILKKKKLGLYFRLNFFSNEKCQQLVVRLIFTYSFEFKLRNFKFLSQIIQNSMKEVKSNPNAVFEPTISLFSVFSVSVSHQIIDGDIILALEYKSFVFYSYFLFSITIARCYIFCFQLQQRNVTLFSFFFVSIFTLFSILEFLHKTKIIFFKIKLK